MLNYKNGQRKKQKAKRNAHKYNRNTLFSSKHGSRIFDDPLLIVQALFSIDDHLL
jgi:hypothetical protein